MSARKKEKKSKTIFKHILIPICILFLVEALIFMGIITGGGVIQTLTQNSRDILQERIVNRKEFLQNEMLANWSQLTLLENKINAAAMTLHGRGAIDITQLDQGSEYAQPLVSAIADSMINNLRSIHVNGVFVVFNNHDLDGEIKDKPGLYIRDLDAVSVPSEKNGDLLVERGSGEMIKQLKITTDVSWRPRLEFSKLNAYLPFLYYPYQEAMKGGEYSASELGYWSREYSLNNDNREVISYSIPLITDDGYVYGVVGAEITHEHLDSLLPEAEINESGGGSYCLAVRKGGEDSYDIVFANGTMGDAMTVDLKREGEETYLKNYSKKTYVAMEKLNLYDTNTPYEDDEWVLLATVPSSELFAFSRRISFILIAAVVLTVGIGLLGALFISFRLSRPLTHLPRQMDRSRKTGHVRLKKTNIIEIDQLVTSIENLNEENLNAASRFSRIIELASIQIAAFEINWRKHEFFMTENFFSVYGQDDLSDMAVTQTEFEEKMQELKKNVTISEGGKYLYKIPKEEEHVFVELTISWLDDEHVVGQAEEVTARILEQKVMEYESDHDALTGLLNRRAFWRRIGELFQNRQKELKIAAFLMIDLDNLKHINDNYGHDTGDTYILRAAESFVANTPKNTLNARISGDEFYIFFYGYDSEEQIRNLLAAMKAGVDDSFITLANQERYYVRMSGGIAWYPRDTRSVEKLKLYSDYAMYKVKHLQKGEFRDFDPESYQSDYYLNRNKEEFDILLRDEQLQYYYQPIVSARTGKTFGYEALMRSYMPTLKSPEEILKLAKQENKLNQIETMSFFKAMEGFVQHMENARKGRKPKLFLNSIANEIISDEKLKEFEERYKACLANIVIEITEGEQVVEDNHMKKQKCVERWGAQLALDDYGSGYNSEKMLLELSPQYIKVDMAIIRSINANRDKQKILFNIVSYAHERGMQVVAEGVETIPELKQVISQDVDLLQGFLLAKPQRIPAGISADMERLIVSLDTAKRGC